MYTVKIPDHGNIVFRGKQVRLPATFNKVSEKDLKLLKVMCHSLNIKYEILEAESERLSKVLEKAKSANVILDPTREIEETNTKIEDLFEGDDTLGDLLKSVGKD